MNAHAHAHVLGGPTPPEADALPAKAAVLDQLLRAGLAVPPGIVVRLDDAQAERDAHNEESAIRGLLRGGPVIVRSALAIEDQATSSGAGLGESVHGCRSTSMIARALATVAGQRRSPDLRDRAIIQREIPAQALLVIASAHALATTLEVYTPGHGALSGAAAPGYVGPLGCWPGEARAAVQALAAQVGELVDSEHGLDLEIVLDAQAKPWLVQARPLTRSLQPGWEDFAAAVAADGEPIPSGWWRLDTEHNPAPLSPAHTSLLAWLGTMRPGVPRVFGGWLYDRIAAELSAAPALAPALALAPAPAPAPAPALDASSNTPTPTPTNSTSTSTSTSTSSSSTSLSADPFAALEHLQSSAIPDARRSLDSVIAQLERGDRRACAALIDVASRAALTMLDTYAALAPARSGRRSTPGSEEKRDRGDKGDQEGREVEKEEEEKEEREEEESLCLADRRRFVDVLPCAWDIAAPSLADLSLIADTAQSRPSSPIPRPSSPSAATWLLRELDDHLFALGLAPLRQVYLRSARLLEIPEADIFFLGIDALRAALHGSLSDHELASAITLGRRRLLRASALRPPPHLFDGAPLPIPAYGHLRGLGIGPTCRGRIAKRSDLAQLIADPPGPGAILVMPTLTVSAALVLDELGVRALCSASGGALSHAALIVRELGISALIGCRGALDLAQGEHVELDTARGRLLRVS